MATAYITEHSGVLPGSDIIEVPKLASNNIAITAGSLASTPFSVNTSIIQVSVDAICSVRFSPTPGATPVATTTDMRMAAGDSRLFNVRPGGMVAVIANT